MLIYTLYREMGKENRKTLVESTLRGFYVPGAGIEPARIAPLVFETSASTDSAIRAGECAFRCLRGSLA